MVDESHKKDGGSGRSGKSRKEAIVRSEEQPTVCTEFFQNPDFGFGEADPTRFNIDIDLELTISPLKGRNHSCPKPSMHTLVLARDGQRSL